MGSDALSQMSDAISIESGVESDYDPKDFGINEVNEEVKTLSLKKKRFGSNNMQRKPASMLMANLKKTQDGTRPPIHIKSFVNS
jgi:hypothetical protein